MRKKMQLWLHHYLGFSPEEPCRLFLVFFKSFSKSVISISCVYLLSLNRISMMSEFVSAFAYDPDDILLCQVSLRECLIMEA